VLPATDEKRCIIIGQVNGLYGVHGAVKIFSYTRPREQIFTYAPWLLKQGDSWQEYRVIEGKPRGKGLTALFAGIHDRDKAGLLIGVDIAVYRYQLPPLPEGEYYWCDLMHLEVEDASGNSLGEVVEIQQTGANDVMVIQGKERILVPLLYGSVVTEVNRKEGRIRIDWNPEYL